MDKMKKLLIGLIVVAVLGTASVVYFTADGSDAFPYQTTSASLREIKLVVSTNGIVEPADRSDIYAPVDGFVASLGLQEGAGIRQGQILMQLNSEQIRSALTEANAALLAAKRQSRIVSAGPSREEVASIDGEIAESQLQLEQRRKELQTENALYQKQATTRLAVEKLEKETDLLQIRVDALKQKKQDLLARYSAEEKEWERGRTAELTKEVEALKRQLLSERILAPISGVIYSLPVKPGSFVTRGQLLAQLYRPGNVRIRAYVDEPDLGRIKKGQQVKVEWDGMPDKSWSGVVEAPAEQVVALNSRSVGNVICSIKDDPTGLIPNLNIRVEITTTSKPDALVIPRSALVNQGGDPAVLLLSGTRPVTKSVELGLITAEYVEILNGIEPGTAVVTNPGLKPR